MMTEPSLLACDWGTTNLRVWVLDGQGQVLRSTDFPFGVSQIVAGETPARFAQVKAALSAHDLPAMLCGMVGSNLGWTAAPYVDCPAGLSQLAEGLFKPPDAAGRVRIVPGVRWCGFNGQGDVMRGEETQLFGWLGAEPARGAGRRLVCHPGTHTKWISVEDGHLTAFVTTMTGELFALLRANGVLRSDAAPDVLAAFDAGVEAAGDGSALSARLFTARARVVGLGHDANSTPSYLSGLLIGADLTTPRLLGFAAEEPVVLIGDVALCELYRRALALRGVASETYDGGAAVRSGMMALWRLDSDAA